MAVDVSVVRDMVALRAIEGEWRALASAGGSGLFRGPDWLIPWWQAYHATLGAELYAMVGRAAEADASGVAVGDIVCLAPLYRRTVKVALLDVRELRLIGDAGPRPPALDLLARAGWEDRAGIALARKLIDEGATWDLIDLEPLADPSRVRAHLVQRMAPAGFTVESSPSAGGATRIALALAPVEATDASRVVTTYGDDLAALRKGMTALRRLSRLEWAERDEPSPLADPEAIGLLEQVAMELGKQGRIRLARLDDPQGEACAAALVVDDGDRAVVLAMAVDPQAGRASARLLHAEALAARARGSIALDVVQGAVEYTLPALPTSKQPVLAVRVWGQSTTASVGRTLSSVTRRARRARETPAVAAAQARAAWTRIRSAAASVAQYDRYCLYRGQLWTRGVEPVAGLELAMFTEADYDKLDDAHRADLLEQLSLDDATARTQWRRGDQAVVATHGVRPAGIAWAARGPIEAPELGRTLRMAKYDAYIHSVYVATAARGRAVAPVMLEQLTKELRATDAYRSWALIAADNHASLRAFQKASFTPVCDVIHAKMATVDRVVCRPPDPEAQELLGLTP
ncbi:MAG: GNAT family N-acetyltransferase [Deltaproteobacteria bacterium]|nr:MAG: GNAT family N-acetyltransferase [Deltaproteobacteria bacterium]TMQ12918.1 MAG: GNAT family N-acetyltransferase [Deltaproteobacteria bacterium]